VFSAVSLVGVDKAQAATLTYNFGVAGLGGGFFKFNNSSLTGIGFEGISVSEGSFLGFTFGELGSKKEDDNVLEATAMFYGGRFLGVQTLGASYRSISDYIIPPDAPYGPRFERYETSGSWYINVTSAAWSRESERKLVNYQSYIEDGSIVIEHYEREFRYIVTNAEVSYTLVNTEPEPVPEPLTSGGTALALAGLSWLKQKKKMVA
jgi:hypothetical protein